MRTDFVSRLADYRGVLGWAAVSGKWVDIEIPLYIKDHPMPIRKQKITEVSFMPNLDPGSGKDIGTQTLFMGSPELLTLNISGWMVTPKLNNQFNPLSKIGNALNIGNISYPELIYAFIEGRMNMSAAGAYVRKDPDYYISPYGHRYNGPIIQSFDAQYSSTMKKQTFSMTLLLET